MKDEDIVFKKIYNIILEKNKVALVMHRKPDGDTIGSAVAFSLFLKQIGKEFSFFCVDEIVLNYPVFLKSIGVLNFEVNTIEKIINYNPDTVVLFDCSDWKQAGFFGEKIISRANFYIINIDHHATNEGMGDVNLIAPDISSTCEIVYNFFKNNKIFITQQIASSLFMGLVTDTRSFSNPATTNSSLVVASRLLLSGAKFKETHKNFICNQSIGILKLWGIALKRLKYSENDGLASTFLKTDDFKNCDVDEESAEGISNFLQGSLNVNMIIVYRELADGLIKASIRSGGDGDASLYAKKFGGGGHKKAAGFTVAATTKEVEDRWEIECS